MPSDLEARGVWYDYGAAPVLRDVSISLAPGDSLAVAGPNGSGKTTLLKLLSGARHPARGAVTLVGRDLRDLSPPEIARHIAVVPQHVDPGLSFLVESVVAMGRTPHTGLLRGPTSGDRAAIEHALEWTETAELRARRFSELSGGEQQRVMLATALAQEARYLLLDEPTVHLDLHHQHEVLELLRRLRAELGIAVLAVMHDLNLAALYFERLALLDRGRLLADASPAEILNQPELLKVFRAPLRVVTHPAAGVPQVLLDRREK